MQLDVACVANWGMGMKYLFNSVSQIDILKKATNVQL